MVSLTNNGRRVGVYSYDPAGTRVAIVANGITTAFPTAQFSTNGTTTTISLEVGGMPLATIDRTATTTEVYATHTDHLRSSRLSTNSAGAITESTDYTPFGAVSTHTQSGNFTERRKYTSHELDTATNYTYAKARYLETNVGRFLSQDPAFVDLTHLEAQLADPQLWNSYTYARNNPLKYIDPDGEFIVPLLILAVPAITTLSYWIATNPGMATFLVGAAVDRPIETGTRSAPIVGDVIDGAEAITGKNAFTGEQLSGIDRIASGASALLPFVSAGTMRVGREANKLWTPGDVGDSIQNALGHWNEHKAEFPELQNAKQYVEEAKGFMTKPSEGTLQHTRKNGDRLFYEPKTNTLGIQTKESIPRTFFKPDPKVHGKATNMDYWKSLLNQ